MDQVKEAFNKVKEDINLIQTEFSQLKSNLNQINKQLIKLCDVVAFLYKQNQENKSKSKEFKESEEKQNTLEKQHREQKQAFQEEISKKNLTKEYHVSLSKDATETFYLPQNIFKKITLSKGNILEDVIDSNTFDTSTDNQEFSTLRQTNTTDNSSFKPLKPQNLKISTGNEGVSTDRQTNRQTNRQIQNNSENSIESASNLLDSLDNIKKELRIKFKRLTNQEIIVFSAIYQLEEEKGFANYKLVSEKLGLTESSIRDYVGRMIQKGIPVDKKKINNKNITLHISQNLKKIASLTTILKLREL